MFNYTFKSKNCLISSISICPLIQVITFYSNKPDDQDNPELNALIDRFSLEKITPGHKEHELVHNPYSMVFNTRSTHTHHRFTGNCDTIPAMINFLLQHQGNTEERITCRTKTIAELEVRRRQPSGKLPEHLQKYIDNFDIITEFIPQEEASHLLDSFNQYLKDLHAPMRLLDEINSFILQLANDKIKGPQLEFLMYGYNIYDGPAPSLPAKFVKDYNMKLKKTSNLFFQYAEDQTIELLSQAQTLYHQIKILHQSLPIMDKLHAYIQNRITESINEQAQSHVSFFSSTFVTIDPNKEENLRLAKDLLEQLENGEVVEAVFANIDQSEITDKELATLIANAKQPVYQGYTQPT